MVSFLVSLLSFAFVITILVFIHELGHYLAARSVGMRVEKFSVGFPPRFLSFTSQSGGWHFKLFFYRKNEKGKLVWAPVFEKFLTEKNKEGSGTEYCLALLPLGGYVKVSGILDESMDPNSTGADYEYQSKKTWQKLWFTSAGVIFNFILAFVILTFSYSDNGYPTNVISAVSEDFQEIILEDIMIDESAPSDKDSFITNISYQSIYENNADGFIKFEKSKGHLVLTNATEKSIKNIKFKLPNIFIVDSTKLVPNPKYASSMTINYDANIIEINSLNGSSLLNSSSYDTLATIFHNKISYNKGPAFKAGLKKDDRILKINNKRVRYARDISDIISNESEEVNIAFNRNGEIHSIKVNPVFLSPKYNIYGELDNKAKIGIRFADEKLGFFESFYVSGYDVLNHEMFGIKTAFKNIFYLITGKLDFDLMSGPVGIAKISGETTQKAGWKGLFLLMAFLSISLGVINILPLPGLDGGHALIAIIEKLKGGKLSAKLQVRIQQVGMLLLMGLFIYIIFKDIIKIIF